MKKVMTLLVTLLSLALFAAKPFEGPWTSEGTVFYLVHPGGPLKIEVTLKKNPGYMGAPVLRSIPSSLLVLMNPEEKVAAMKYWKVSGNEKEQHYTLEYPKAPAGIWQLRSTFSFCANMSLQFKTTPKLKYGVLFSRSRILADDALNIRNSYFLVPPPVTPLNLKQPSLKDFKKTIQKLHLASRARQTEFWDRKGRKLFSADIYEIVSAMSDIYCNANIELPFGTTEVTREVSGPAVTIRTMDRKNIVFLNQDSGIVLPLKENQIYQCLVNMPSPKQDMINGAGYLSVDGFPVIFCPDPATARAINGSVVKAKDGRQFAYRFQKEMYEWMKSLKKSDLEVKIVPVSKYRKEWLADSRSEGLFTRFAYAEHILRSQETDPGKLTFGTSPLNLDQLTLLYALKRPWNPYYGNKALMNRIFLHYFRKWLSLAESGAFYDDPEHGAYCGGLEWSGWEGMVFTTDYISLVMMKDLADKKLLELWSEALKLPLYRFWCHRLTCENQSLHWPLKLYAMNMYSKDPLYLTLVRDYLKDLADPEMSRSMKTGYFMEAYGLDGTYPGISSSMLAFAAKMSGDDAALASLKKFYNLMAHTIVREPDGSLAGVNGFGHRTAGTWLNAQYGGGVTLLDDRLEDAAVVSQRHIFAKKLTEREFDRYANTKFPADLEKWCKGPGHVMFGYGMAPWLPLWYHSVFPMGKMIKHPKLPTEKSMDFRRNFNNEFYACRTSGYYAFFYTGNYDWRWRYLRRQDSPLPTGTKLKNGELYTAESSCPWMTMQGLNLFWTPKFGIFLSAHNWSMYTQNLVRADRQGKVVDFPACYTAETSLKGKELEITHKTKFIGLTVKRKSELERDKVKVSLKVSSPEKIEATDLIEQIPYRIKSDLKFTCYSGKKAIGFPGDRITAIKVSRANGSSILIKFNRPVTVRQGYRSSATFNYPKFYVGLLEIVFQKNYTKGPSEFSYEIFGELK